MRLGLGLGLSRGLIGLGVLAALIAVDVQTAAAEPRPWCLRGGLRGMDECLFQTFQQCYESSKGIGGTCTENPAIAWQRLKSGRTPEVPRRKSWERRN